MLQKRGQKPLELVIGGLLLFVAAAYIVELAFSQPQLAPLLKGMALPDLPNGDAVFLAAGVLGATIMPHVIICIRRSPKSAVSMIRRSAMPPPKSTSPSP